MVAGLFSAAQAHDHQPPGRFKVILAALVNGDLVIPAVGVMERAVYALRTQQADLFEDHMSSDAAARLRWYNGSLDQSVSVGVWCGVLGLDELRAGEANQHGVIGGVDARGCCG